MEKYQTQLHEIVCNVMSDKTTNKDFETYQSVLSMVYSLIEDERTNELNELLKNSFTEYYLTNE